jgi:hypothetical protein
MDTSIDISAAIFAAYLKWPTKAYVIANSEKSSDTFFADIRERISTAIVHYAAYESRFLKQ